MLSIRPAAFLLALLSTITAAAAYEPCGGFRPDPPTCPEGEICIDDPFSDDCGMACDLPGICVEPVFCGGYAGIKCKDEEKTCVDDPRDDCDPKKGGADCGGICV